MSKVYMGVEYPLSYCIEKCSFCKIRKPLTSSFFPKRSKSPTGFRRECKQCLNFKVRQRYNNNPNSRQKKKEYRKRNAKRISDYQKEYTKKNKERIKLWKKEYNKKNTKQLSINSKKYREENAESISAQRKQHYKENREKILEERKEYYENNLEQIKQYREKYTKEGRARGTDHRKRMKRSDMFEKLPSDFTLEEWGESLEFFNHLCCYCGIESDRTLEQDHFIPLSKMGAYTKDNIVPACKSCNSSKHTQDFQAWYRKHKHYCPEREHLILSYIEIRKWEKNA